MVGLGNITFYADNPRRLSHFWADVFGYPRLDWTGDIRQQQLDAGLTDDDLARRGLAEDPEGKGPRFYFHHADSVKTGRNRLHIDVNATPGRSPSRAELDAERDRIVALGASVVRFVDQTWGAWPEIYYQMQDPEGNEFCLQ